MHIFTRPKDNDSTVTTDTKQPAVHSSPITTDSSTLHSDSPPLHSFHSHPSASHNSKSASLLRWTRLALSFLSIAMGLTTVGCAAHILARYNGTVFGGEWYLPLWPVNVDVRPTVTAAVTGAIVVLGNLIYLGIGAVSKTQSHLSSPTNVIFAFISIISLVVSLFAVIYCHVVTFIVDADTRYTPLTFTCGLYDNARSFTSGGSSVGLLSSAAGTSGLLPSGFGRLCVESQVARWMMVALFVVEVVALGVAVIGMLGDKKMEREERERDMNTGMGFHGGRDEKSAFA